MVSLTGQATAADPTHVPPAQRCERVVTAHVAAIEQQYVYNRFGASNPDGMIFALRRDIVRSFGDDDAERDGPLIARFARDGGEPELAGKVHLRSGKRPRPLVLRANVGDCLEVHFTNLLDPTPSDEDVREGEMPATRTASLHVNGLDYLDIGADGAEVGRNPSSLAAPGETRVYRWFAAAEGGYMLQSMAAPTGGEGDGGQVGLGLFGAVMVQPRSARWYRSQLTEGELRQVMHVGPAGNPIIPNYDKTIRQGDEDLPILNLLHRNRRGELEIVHNDLNAIVELPPGAEYCGDGERGPPRAAPGNVQGENPDWSWPCGRSYREFTVIFHDELNVRQAFNELDPETAGGPNALQSLRDNMGINYGAAGMGSIVLSNRRRGASDPAQDCAECKLEEFFLTSWANGDPALVIARPPRGPAHARYPEDPSNVHHSYLGDPVRFRNLHAGPKETHVFHLHSHQWQYESADPGSLYLDSQTISPGASFTYKIQYHGSGNRNLTPGDAIFHCHLYPHFAQGMWELWRVHDTFEDGSVARWYPDGEPALRDAAVATVIDGRRVGRTPNPALVPLPGQALAPMPSRDFPGYPFYIAAQAGHRPSQPPLDFARDGVNNGGSDPYLDGGLPRHTIAATDTHIADGGGARPVAPAERADGMAPSLGLREQAFTPAQRQRFFNTQLPETDPESGAAATAERVRQQNRDPRLLALQSRLTAAELRLLPEDGTGPEQVAMGFHAGDRPDLVYPGLFPRRGPGRLRSFETAFADEWWWRGRGYASCTPSGRCFDPSQPPESQRHLLFRVNGRRPQPGAPYADPCPATYVRPRPDSEGRREFPVRERDYRAAYIQFDMAVNKAGWHDQQARIAVLENDIGDTLDNRRPPEPLFIRANSGECVSYTATNLVPSALNLDDFQVFSPTDTIGQHIHLVKFDVTSSDGSGNGWNYEDGTFSPDEVRERIIAHARRQIQLGRTEHAAFLAPRTHEIFRPGGAMAGHSLADYGRCPEMPADPANPAAWEVFDDPAHRWCGAQSTVQRWWADPLFGPALRTDATGYDTSRAHDKTLRTVFTHDHFGPSSHQQHGLYAALVVEPSNSVWRHNATDNVFGGSRDGGGTAEPIPPGRPDGGPTSFAARIETYPSAAAIDTSNGLSLDRKPEDARREYNLAIADYALLYTAREEGNRPVNPPSRREAFLPIVVTFDPIPQPEGISTADPGGQLLNYRNEPAPLRLGRRDGDRFILRTAAETLTICRPLVERTRCADGDDACRQDNAPRPCRAGDMACILRACDPGDPANLFSSRTHAYQQTHPRLNLRNEAEPPGQRQSGDPATSLLWAYNGERAAIRLIQGAQEENHVFTVHGTRWREQPDSLVSGWTNAQAIGISEHFESEMLLNDPTQNPSGAGQHGLPRNLRGDHLYGTSGTDNFWDGQWGLFRFLARPEDEARTAAAEPTGTASTDNTAQTGVADATAGALDNNRGSYSGPGLRGPGATPATPDQVGSSPPRLPRTERQRQRAERQVEREEARREHGVAAPRTETQAAPMPYRGFPPPPERRRQAVLAEQEALNSTRPGDQQVDIQAAEEGADDDRDRQVCPLNAPIRTYRVEAWRARELLRRPGRPPREGVLGYNEDVGLYDPNAILFIESRHRAALRHGDKRPEPLILRAAAGECIRVFLYNRMEVQPSDSGEPGRGRRDEILPTDGYNLAPPIVDGFNLNQAKPSDRVSLHAHVVRQNYAWQGGAFAGTNTDSTVPPHERGRAIRGRLYEWFAGDWAYDVGDPDRGVPMELGVLPLVDMADPIFGPQRGAIGALVVLPRGARWETDCDGRGDDGPRLAGCLEAAATVYPSPHGDQFAPFRDLVLFVQDALALHGRGEALPAPRGEDDAEDTGHRAFNYRAEPLWARFGEAVDTELNDMNRHDHTHVFSSLAPGGGRAEHGDPATPLFLAPAGMPVRLRVVHPGGHPRHHAFSLSGHNWPLVPWQRGEPGGDTLGTPVRGADRQGIDPANRLRVGTANAIGPARHLNLLVTAGGTCHVPGDYLYRAQESSGLSQGMWGILRVYGRGSAEEQALRLPAMPLSHDCAGRSDAASSGAAGKQ